MPPSKRLNDV